MHFLNEQKCQERLSTPRTSPFIAISLVLIYDNSPKFASKCTVLLVQM